MKEFAFQKIATELYKQLPKQNKNHIKLVSLYWSKCGCQN